KRKSDQLPLSDKHVELLQEATASAQAGSSGDRPIKKRKSARKSEDGASSTVSVTKEVDAESSRASSRINSDAEVTDGNVDEDEDDEESDVEWESIDLSLQQPGSLRPTPQPPSTTLPPPPAPKQGGIEITLNPPPRPKATKRLGLTAIDRKIRLETHKLDLMCLLSHLSLRNAWCNSSSVHRFFRPLLPEDVKTALRGSGEGLTQYLRSQAFVEGLKTAGEVWRGRFTVTRTGLRKPVHWDAKSLENAHTFDLGGEEVTSETFVKAAQGSEGSRDLGAQLFVALLRSVGVEARLVGSLQVLPIGGGEGVAPPYPKKRAGVEKAKDKGKQKAVRSSADSTPQTPPNAPPRPPSKPSTPAASPHSRPPPAIESAYPVYWCEAFDTNAQKWIAADPLVTHQVNRPQKLEPPLSDPFNTMAYVLAVERDGCVRDVTKRYTKAFNAKTRKIRLESTKEGGKWWEQVLEIYARTQEKARDQIEEAQLERRVAAESIPKNVQDLKNHPIFVLERHLKREEVLLPGAKACGSITIGRAGAQVSEYVYRRKDVVGVKSAERWWRVGRVIRVGEQAMKRVKAHRRLNVKGEEEDEEGETAGEMVGLYSEQQTDLYVPSPVTNGKVPKNNYGNIDVYVPSMIPAGARHLPRKGIDRIAKLIGIDYADAVIGFEFRNRIATPVVKGIVVAEEYVEAVLVGWSCLVQEQEEKKVKVKERRALKRWRRFVAGLRIRERLQMDDIVEGGFASESYDTAGAYAQPIEEGGGFLPE
ncbi:Rad4-domain-containing protein, partial [Saitoella complicata NRRL Y-17804]|uniref:Rad4-domain-containing protein n=1 Tax=Saitoella complicata (strain BCRC 22490 / CBS 7301 / JCM 7358 / NBRC 10748 / NRRL Y-17804) TaxID=698492 RepID=UPI0008672037